LNIFISFPIAILGLYLQGQLNETNEKYILTVAVVSISSSLVAAGFFFSKKIRTKLTQFAVLLGRKVLKKDFSTTLHSLNDAFSKGADAIKQKPKTFWAMEIFVLVNWLFVMLVLYCCARTLNVEINIFVIVVAFAIAVTLVNFSFIPSGWGIQEGSLAGIFTLFNVDIGVSVIISILFRVTHYFSPAIVGLIVYWFDLRKYVGKEEIQN
jgi:uncharacterized protein (TIRG00374 family)